MSSSGLAAALAFEAISEELSRQAAGASLATAGTSGADQLMTEPDFTRSTQEQGLQLGSQPEGSAGAMAEGYNLDGFSGGDQMHMLSRSAGRGGPGELQGTEMVLVRVQEVESPGTNGFETRQSSSGDSGHSMQPEGDQMSMDRLADRKKLKCWQTEPHSGQDREQEGLKQSREHGSSHHERNSASSETAENGSGTAGIPGGSREHLRERLENECQGMNQHDVMQRGSEGQLISRAAAGGGSPTRMQSLAQIVRENGLQLGVLSEGQADDGLDMAGQMQLYAAQVGPGQSSFDAGHVVQHLVDSGYPPSGTLAVDPEMLAASGLQLVQINGPSGGLQVLGSLDHPGGGGIPPLEYVVTDPGQSLELIMHPGNGFHGENSERPWQGEQADEATNCGQHTEHHGEQPLEVDADGDRSWLSREGTSRKVPAADTGGDAEAPSQEMMQEDDLDMLKTRIVLHPLYEQLLEAHVACLKVATPLDQLPLLDLQLERSELVAGKYRALLRDNHQILMDLGQDDGELDRFMAQFVVLLRSFKKQLEEHVKVHAREAVLACWELEQSLISITGMEPGPGTGATMSDDEDNDGSESELGRFGAREHGASGPYGPLVPTESERTIMERMRDELKMELKQGYKDKISDVREEIMRKRRAGKLPGDTTAVLKAWWNGHAKWPYPTEEEKAVLVNQTGLELKQINNWFINQRKRNWHTSPQQQASAKAAKRKQAT